MTSRNAELLAQGPRYYWCSEGQVFECVVVTADRLAAVGHAEAIGAGEAFAAMQVAALEALADRKGKDAATLVAGEEASRAAKWAEKIAESPEAQAEFIRRTGAWFAASVVQLGKAKAGVPVGACTALEAEYLEPAAIVLREDLEDLAAEVPRFYVGRWLPGTWQHAGMRAMAAREEIAKALRPFREVV